MMSFSTAGPSACAYGSNTAVLVGISLMDYQRVLDRSAESGGNAFVATGQHLSVAAGRISYLYGFRGASMSIDTACCSSLVAAHSAREALRQAPGSANPTAALVAGVGAAAIGASGARGRHAVSLVAGRPRRSRRRGGGRDRQRRFCTVRRETVGLHDLGSY